MQESYKIPQDEMLIRDTVASFKNKSNIGYAYSEYQAEEIVKRVKERYGKNLKAKKVDYYWKIKEI